MTVCLNVFPEEVLMKRFVKELRNTVTKIKSNLGTFLRTLRDLSEQLFCSTLLRIFTPCSSVYVTEFNHVFPCWLF